MATIDQSKVRSGFDVEALLGERYLQMLFGTALDAGLIPAELEFSGQTIVAALVPQEFRMYEPTPNSDGDTRSTHSDAFKTEILFGHPLGANVKVRVMLGRRVGVAVLDLDLFARIGLIKTFDGDGALTEVGMDLQVVDVDSTQLGVVLNQPTPPLTKDELLMKIKEKVDRRIDIGGPASSRRSKTYSSSGTSP